MRKYLTTGLFSAILGIVIGGAPADAALVSRGFLDEALENYATTTALDLKANQSDFTELSNKIGELPSGSLIGDSPAMDSLFMYTQNTDTPVYPNSLSDLINQLYGSTGGPGAITALLHGFKGFGGYGVPVGILPAMDLGFSATQAAETAQETATAAKTAADTNTAKIGTLPSGNFPGFPESENLFSKLRQPLTYPTSLAELITAIYGNSETGGPGLLAGIFAGFPIDTDGDGQIDSNAGTISNFVLARDANNLATENATKIGTLPEGEIAPSPGFDSFLRMYSAITNTPISYPTSVAEFVELLLGNSSNPGLLGLMSGGVSSIDSNSGTPIGIHANYSRINNMSEKIGTLPDGYETVGAALTAIKGIAEDAKATALSAIPDPKTEGSTGKFVLTVDIVGDNATYRWEKIDREGEATTTE